MNISFPAIYHNATMIRLLRDQGATQTALELAEFVLRERPDNAEVATLARELKAASEAAFARFQKSGIEAAKSKVKPPSEGSDLA